MSFEDLVEASREIDANLPIAQKAKHYYDGEDSSRFLASVFNDFFKQEDFTGTLNYASIPVDAVADRLQLLSILGPDDATTEQIRDLLDANKMNMRLGQFILDVLTYGEYFVAVWPDEQEASDLFDLDADSLEVELVDDTPLNRKAKMMFCDAETTRAFYDDGGEQRFIARKWESKDFEGKEIIRVNLYYIDRVEKYWWFKKDDIATADAWLDDDQTEWPMDNPYGSIPIFQFSTGFPHGKPEHRSMFGVQDALNKIFQVHISSIEYLGYPIIYTLMDETSAAGTSDFEYAPIDNTESDAGSDVNKLKNNPGEVWALRAKSVGQIEPAGSSNFIDSLKTYKEIASEVTGLPARLFSSTDGQHPGADAVNAADAVLRQRVVDRSVILSEQLKQMISFALKMAFGKEVPAKEISVQWRPQSLQVDAAMIAVFEFKRALGVPEEQILTELGYTQAEIDIFKPNIEEKRRVAEDARQAGMENAAKAARTSGNTDDSSNEGKGANGSKANANDSSASRDTK